MAALAFYISKKAVKEEIERTASSSHDWPF
jgi:hypothetical protein